MKTRNTKFTSNHTRGSISIDFVFGLVLVAGVSFILIALCLTMVVVEITQYVAFASSRSYFGAHRSNEIQEQRGRSKFEAIMAHRGLSKVLNGEWFGVVMSGIGDFRKEYPASEIDHDNDTFFGSRIDFTAKVLNLNLPFLGASSPDSSYKATISSYLGREPTFEECMDFNSQRWKKYKEKFPLSVSQGPEDSGKDYAVIADNGC